MDVMIAKQKRHQLVPTIDSISKSIQQFALMRGYEQKVLKAKFWIEDSGDSFFLIWRITGGGLLQRLWMSAHDCIVIAEIGMKKSEDEPVTLFCEVMDYRYNDKIKQLVQRRLKPAMETIFAGHPVHIRIMGRRSQQARMVPIFNYG
jgi:hypothetical protein